jgi:hypothetical protein
MNEAARVFLELLTVDVSHHASRLAQRIRAQLPPAMLQSMTPEQHRGLIAGMRDELRLVVQSFLGHFDNVGCHLPAGVSGYSIMARTPSSGPDEPRDIRLGEQDYADMWLDFLYQRKDTADPQ